MLGGDGRPPMIGYAAVTQAAGAVASMLGGPPSNDRRVQEQLNELLASKSRPELWEVLRLLREFLGGERSGALQYFSERPGLAKAVFQAQVLLGELHAAAAAAAAGAANVRGSSGQHMHARSRMHTTQRARARRGCERRSRSRWVGSTPCTAARTGSMVLAQSKQAQTAARDCIAGGMQVGG